MPPQGNEQGKLEFAFKMYDTNQDGSIQRPELKGFLQDFFAMSKDQTKKMLDSFCSMFPGDDARFKQQVSKQIVQRTEEFIAQATDQALAHGSGGELTFEDFKRWCGRGDGMATFLGDIGSRLLDSIDADDLDDLGGGGGGSGRDLRHESDSWPEKAERAVAGQDQDNVARFFDKGKTTAVADSFEGSGVRIGSPTVARAAAGPLDERRGSAEDFLSRGVQRSQRGQVRPTPLRPRPAHPTCAALLNTDAPGLRWGHRSRTRGTGRQSRAAAVPRTSCRRASSGARARGWTATATATATATSTASAGPATARTPSSRKASGRRSGFPAEAAARGGGWLTTSSSSCGAGSANIAPARGRCADQDSFLGRLLPVPAR